MTKRFIRKCWTWLNEENNRGRLIVIATLATPFIMLAGTMVTNGMAPAPPQSGGEVRLSVKNFQAVLEEREQEVEKRLGHAHGDEHIRLEKALTEAKRQLSNVESAHAEVATKIREPGAGLAGLGDDFGNGQLAEIRTAMEAGCGYPSRQCQGTIIQTRSS